MDRPTRTRKGRAPAALAILGAAALVAASLLLAAEGARAGDDRRTIATVASNGFRVQVEAVRTPGGGGAPGARVRTAAFERRGGAWARMGRALPVRPAPGADEFFWKVVTAPGACATCPSRRRRRSGSP